MRCRGVKHSKLATLAATNGNLSDQGISVGSVVGVPGHLGMLAVKFLQHILGIVKFAIIGIVLNLVPFLPGPFDLIL